jgi:hypothetical protein
VVNPFNVIMHGLTYETLDEKPSFTFWTTLAKAFENQTKQALQCEAKYLCHD